MNEVRAQRRHKQLDALWKWEWLGMRDSTPAFKLSLVAIAAVVLVAAKRAFFG